MADSFKFHRTRLDEIVEAFSDEERLQLIMEGDHLERHGSTGEGILRQKTNTVIEKLTMGGGSFDATWMVMIVASCHKIQSIRSLEAEMHLSDDPAP